jgi:hypothetical protein
MRWEETCSHESGGERDATDQKRTGGLRRRARRSRAGGAILLTWPSTCLHRLVLTANPSLKSCARPYAARTNRKPRYGTAGLAL